MSFVQVSAKENKIKPTRLPSRSTWSSDSVRRVHSGALLDDPPLLDSISSGHGSDAILDARGSDGRMCLRDEHEALSPLLIIIFRVGFAFVPFGGA